MKIICLATCALAFTLLACPVSTYAETSVKEADADTPAAEIKPDTDSQRSDGVESEEQPKKTKTIKDPNRGRILPIPVFITEPAVGEGFGLVLAYFHRKKDASPSRAIESPSSIAGITGDQAPPPTVTGVFGGYTSNETAAGGVGHMNSFRDDHIRFSVLGAYANVNSTVYLADQPLKFNLKGFLAFQETRFRIADSKWFWGIGLTYLDASSNFSIEPPEETFVDLFRSDFRNAGLAGELAWDTRDNTSMPNSGQLFDLSLWRYDDAFSGDYDYWNAKIKLLSFHQLHEKFVLGARLEYSAIDGRAPFFGYPWVSLRGIAAMRYQGEQVTTAEIEGRYELAPKWSLIGFAGTGWASSDIPSLDTEQSIYNFGVGGRYKIFEAQNVWIGIDIAKGPEDYNWYIQVGQAW